MYDELIKGLREDMEWAEANEWETPIMLFDHLKQAADAIEKLSKRETPMRVRRTTSTKRCPSCNKQVSMSMNTHYNYRFCRWCGQALDWTEPPKDGE